MRIRYCSHRESLATPTWALYEFRGDSLDTTPPAIVSTQPIAVGTSGDTGGKVNAVKLLFSEDVNAIDASTAAVYELRKSGLNGFGSADDVIYSLTGQYTPGSPVATLKINGLNGAGLPVGQFRLTVTSDSTPASTIWPDCDWTAMRTEAKGATMYESSP